MAHCSRARVALALSLGAAVTLCLTAANAQEVTDPLGTIRPDTYTLGDWGGVGLMQTRTARFAPDGAFDVSYSFVDPYKRYSFTLNALPWLEGTFRYTEVRNKLYGDASFSGDQRYKDRGADLKFRLLQEHRFFPAVAIGFQDLLGTGLFAGEYLVASKRWRDFDFSAGLGWGQIGSAGTVTNPLISISDEFRQRTGPTGTGGQVAFETFFGGETVGGFGGVEYRTPFEGLTLKLEYDAHRFRETDLDHPSKTPINFGFVFRPYSWLELSFGRERGTTTMLRFSLRTNIQSGGLPKQDPPPPAITPRPTVEQLTAATAPAPRAIAPAPAAAPRGPAFPTAPAPAPGPAAPVPIAPPAARTPAPAAALQPQPIFDLLLDKGFSIDGFTLGGTEAWVTVSRTTAGASLRDAAIAALDRLPPDVTGLTLFDFSGGRDLERAEVHRNQAANLRFADDLYGRMAALNLDVVAVDFVGNDVRVTVAPRERRLPVNLAVVARETAAALPLGGSVTATNGVTGESETWLAFGSAMNLPSPAPALPGPRINPAAAAGQDLRLSPIDRPYSPEQQNALRSRLYAALQEQGIALEALDLQPRAAFVALSAFRFRQFSRNLGLAARVVVNNLPAPIEEVTIAFLNGGLEMERVKFLRSDLERVAANAAPEELWGRAEVTAGQPWQPGHEVAERYPAFTWSLTPQLRQHIGGPNQFYLYQFWLALTGNVDVARGLTLTAQVGKNLYHNFDKITLLSDSSLPHVRSDIRQYLQEGADNIVRLQANYLFKPAESIYARVTAGIFEEMYGGLSTEVLYRPFNSRLAIGAEWNWVRQRDYDQRFKFLDYEVQTGHVSLYYDTPLSGVLVAAHVGTYLAGDRGVTLELSRRFDSGMRVGAWATFTNVTPERFGEGSFDKGFFITIPFDLFFTRSSPAQGVFAFRPLTRDGGQRLVVMPRLYDLTADHSLEGITRDWPQLLR